MRFISLMLLLLTTTFLGALEVPAAPDPIGLGPRLAELDYLKEHKVAVPAGASEDEVHTIYKKTWLQEPANVAIVAQEEAAKVAAFKLQDLRDRITAKHKVVPDPALSEAGLIKLLHDLDDAVAQKQIDAASERAAALEAAAAAAEPAGESGDPVASNESPTPATGKPGPVTSGPKPAPGAQQPPKEKVDPAEALAAKIKAAVDRLDATQAKSGAGGLAIYVYNGGYIIVNTGTTQVNITGGYIRYGDGPSKIFKLWGFNAPMSMHITPLKTITRQSIVFDFTSEEVK